MRFPIILSRDEPEESSVGEWREVSYSRALQGGWVICESHRWQDFENHRPHFTMEILSAPLRTEDEASTALDVRVEELGKQGWVHRFQMEFDPKTGTPFLKRISPRLDNILLQSR
jgi:hypothetical protein